MESPAARPYLFAADQLASRGKLPPHPKKRAIHPTYSDWLCDPKVTSLHLGHRGDALVFEQQLYSKSLFFLPKYQTITQT